MRLGFLIGEKFDSWKDLENALIDFENSTNCIFSTRSSRTISANKRRCDYEIKDELKYSEITKCCVQGGRNPAPNGKIVNSIQIGCPVYVHFRSNYKTQTIDVVSMNLIHNHETSKIIFERLKSRKRLADEDKSTIKNYLSLTSNITAIQSKLKEKLGKIIPSKKILNIKNSENEIVDNLPDILNSLKKYNYDYSFEVDNNNCLSGLFFQDDFMKNMLKMYPEICLADFTYKLLSNHMSVFILAIIDSFGKTQIGAVGLVLGENLNNLKFLLNTLKEKNPYFSDSLISIITDKDIHFRNVFKEYFPNVNLLLCHFHTSQTFERVLTQKFMEVNSDELINGKKLYYLAKNSKNLQEYFIICEKIKNLPGKLSSYFFENWFKNYAEWVPNLMYCYLTFDTCTNNRLESLNHYIKENVKKNSKILNFIDQFHNYLDSMKAKRKYESINEFIIKQYNLYNENSPEYKYSCISTKYAFNEIKIELSQYLNIEITTDIENKDIIETISDGQSIHFSKNSCSCRFFKSMGLPCRHIFYFKNFLKEDLFDELLVNYRWKKSYAKEMFISDESNENKIINLNSLNKDDSIYKNNFENTFDYNDEIDLIGLKTIFLIYL